MIFPLLNHQGRSDKIKALLALDGKRQIDLAAHFGISKQAMNNKMVRNSWSVSDLTKVADFVGCKVAFVFRDEQKIFLEPEDCNKQDK